MKLKKLLGVLFALSLVAAACGSDSGGDAGGDDTTATTADSGGGDDGGGDDGGDDDGGGDGGDAGEILTDVGVDDETIKVGLLTDLTGVFAGLTVPITDGTEAYFERLNDNGGVAGRNVELTILDTAYDVPTHQQHYDTVSSTGNSGVAMIGSSVGSPHTASIRDDLTKDDMFAIPLSWNSSWSADESANIFEWGTNYCVEAINGISWMADEFDASTIAIVTQAGDYGEDGAIGAKLAAEAAGLELVYDGQAAIVPGADQTPVVTGIVESGADIVWIVTSPGVFAQIIGGAAAAGFTGQWGGNGPTHNPALMDTAVAPVLDAFYTSFAPYPAFGAGDSAGMADIVAMMREYRPDAQYLGVYVISWIQGEIVRQVLEAAAANGDMTRAGIVAAAQSTPIDMQGVIPDLDYSADGNDFIGRSSYIFDVEAASYNQEATVLDDGGDGLALIDNSYQSATAEAFEYEPCFGI